MKDKVMISITEKEEGLEIRVSEESYGNLAVIGLLEKIKLNLLSDFTEEIYTQKKSNKEPKSNKEQKNKYDA